MINTALGGVPHGRWPAHGEKPVQWPAAAVEFFKGLVFKIELSLLF